MYALLNRDEVMLELAKKMLEIHLKKYQPTWPSTTEYVNKSTKSFLKTGLISVDFKIVNNCLNQDLQHNKDHVVTEYKSKFRPLVNWLTNNFHALGLDQQYLINLCVNSNQPSFVKNFAQQLDPACKYVIDQDHVDPAQTLILRNIINNESVLAERISNQQPFWFIDSGYTNFLTDKKSWHRVVQNHIHHSIGNHVYPADRLQLLDSFPRPWRTGGSKILVVESSHTHFELFGDKLEHWRNRICLELAKHTDRPIEFRPKDTNRKTRDNLYKKLISDSDYYCVITDASGAAIEAIWAGIPVITLNQHITNPVAKRNINDIEDLYRGDIGKWLCALSYNQFTKKEIFNGDALRIIQEHNNV
jgi:hypothetical protein